MKRFDVFLVGLDPTVGSEMRKTRPCAIVSADELNKRLNTVIVVPLTSNVKPYPFRPGIVFQRKAGSLALDHIRAVDKSRLVRKLGRLDPDSARRVADTLVEMFSGEA